MMQEECTDLQTYMGAQEIAHSAMHEGHEEQMTPKNHRSLKHVQHILSALCGTQLGPQL